MNWLKHRPARIVIRHTNIQVDLQNQTFSQLKGHQIGGIVAHQKVVGLDSQFARVTGCNVDRTGRPKPPLRSTQRRTEAFLPVTLGSDRKLIIKTRCKSRVILRKLMPLRGLVIFNIITYLSQSDHQKPKSNADRTPNRQIACYT